MAGSFACARARRACPRAALLGGRAQTAGASSPTVASSRRARIASARRGESGRDRARKVALVAAANLTPSLRAEDGAAGPGKRATAEEDETKGGKATRGLGQGLGKTGAPAAFAMQAGIFGTILDVFYVAVLVRILTSWFPNLPPLLDPVVNLARQITDPVFQPFRQLIPPLRLGSTMVDISGIIVIFLINFLRRYA